ncbi:uncharacterized protein LOC109415860 [Aedes albopictus]|uniref:Secreted protein n=1 Tax=Aedes albopictus TaxID=7160 RepID=A0ABM1Z257_AEDAL|nr:uncharacterized protein LOC109415860 [Aedes albopictus]
MGSLVLKLLLISVVFCDHGEAMAQYGQMDSSMRNLIGPEVLLARLDKLLDVCIENYEDLTTDLLLGVAIANGQVKSILADTHYENRSFIETLKKKGDYVESRINSIFSFPSSANAVVSKLLINSDFWKTDAEGDSEYNIFPDTLPSSDSIEDAIPAPAQRQSHGGRHTFHSYLRALQLGAPSELQSDECLSELLVNESENEFDTTVPAGGGASTHPRAPLLLSRECSNAMSLRKKSYGYHLTHKLLFYLILGKQHFSNIQQEFVTTAKDKLCEQILRESQLIADLSYPEIFRDLFMEQVFLCAYVGYAEFRNQSWLGEIVSWQNDAGCFKYYQDEGRVGPNALTTECSTHMTGVGAAVMGLFARLQLIG